MARRPPPIGPDNFRTIYELPVFTRRWEQLSLGDGEMISLCAFLMSDPDGPPLVPGAGKLRKARFSPSSWQTGESGAVRVYYAHFGKFGVLLLAVAFGKNEASDIGPTQKRQLAAVVDEFEKELAARSARLRARKRGKK